MFSCSVHAFVYVVVYNIQCSYKQMNLPSISSWVLVIQNLIGLVGIVIHMDEDETDRHTHTHTHIHTGDPTAIAAN